MLGLRSWAEFGMFVTSIVTGLTMVMGVNAVNSAPSFMLDYYKYIDKDPSATPGNSYFWKNVLTFYTVVTLVAQTIHEPTNLTSFMCRFSLIFRLEMSALLMLVELLVIVILPRTGASENAAIAALMVVAYLGGAARAYFENTGYALFGPCPSKMLSGMLVGSALSGALVSVIQIILKASMADTYESILTQSALYFSLSMGIIFISAVSLVTLLFNPYAKHHIAEFRSRRSVWANIYRHVAHVPEESDDEAGAYAGLDAVGAEPAAGESGKVATVRATREEHIDDDVLFDDRAEPVAGGREGAHGSGGASERSSAAQSLTKGDALGEVDAPTTSEILQQVRLWPVIKEIYPMMISCLLTFGITYLLYPGLLLAVDAEDGWYTTWVMATYNIGDLVGRSLSMWKRLWPSRRVILIGSIARIVFVPLLFLCAFGKIPTHAAAYVFTALLAVTNGFFGTLSMVYAPDTATLVTDGERAMAGQANGVMLLLGCSIGSLVQIAEVIPFS